MIVSSNHAAQKLWREINGPDVDPDSIAQPRHYTAELVRRAIPRILEEERRDYRDKVKARIIAAQGDYGWNALAHYFDD